MADLIDQYEAHLRTLRRAPATIELYASVLRRADRELPEGLAGANTDELQEWLYADKADGDPRSPGCLHSYRNIIDGLYRWATDPREPRIDWNPAALLPDRQRIPRRVPRPITVKQLTDIISRAAEPYRTWYLLAAYGGLRCCEVAAIDREHINEQTSWINGKGSHTRIVPTDPYVWVAVKDLPPGPVARDRRGGRARREDVRQRANNHLHRRLAAPDVTMHRLRHTYATNIYQATGDIQVTRALLGHASVATTQIYAEVASAAMVAAVAALPRLTRGALPEAAAAAAA